MDQITESLKKDKYNVDLWNTLLNRHASPEKLRESYDSFLSVFPSAARYWKNYIEKEMATKSFANVEKLFKKCLFNCLDVDLWRTYVSYIRTVKQGTPTELRDINTAYEFVIKNVGMDLNSTSIWYDHLSFLKNELKGVPEEDRKKAIRAVYHLALVTPMSGVDQIWREYDSWEHINDKTLAKGMLAGLYQQHQNAKACCLHRKRLKRSILPGMLARPPYGSSKTHQREYLQVIHWKKLIDYEKSNPQKLNATQLEERVVFTYKQALMYLRFYPEVWDSYANYFFDRHTLKDACGVYEEAIESLPGNLTINFLYAEFLESHKEIANTRKVYEKLLENHKMPLVYVQFQRFSRRCETKEHARKIFVDAKNQPGCSFHIYLSSAYIEHFCNNEPKIALKILNLGLERFSASSEFVSAYLDFMEHQTDINNMRELYERVLAQMDNKQSEVIWDKYIQFETRHCTDLKALKSLNTRRAKTLNLPEIKVEINHLKRYSFMDLLVCPKEYLDTMEKTLFAKIQDIPIESNTVTKKSQKTKAYTFKGVTKFFSPRLETLIEIKPGVPFLDSTPLFHTKSGAAWPIPEISSSIKRLLSKLPDPGGIQGIDVHPEYVTGKIRNSDISVDKNSTLAVKKIVVKEKPMIDGDLFLQRRRLTGSVFNG